VHGREARARTGTCASAVLFKQIVGLLRYRSATCIIHRIADVFWFAHQPVVGLAANAVDSKAACTAAPVARLIQIGSSSILARRGSERGGGEKEA
jgi:hypothetical protein